MDGMNISPAINSQAYSVGYDARYNAQSDNQIRRDPMEHGFEPDSIDAEDFIRGWDEAGTAINSEFTDRQLAVA